MITRERSPRSTIRRVVSTPSIPGMRTSISTTSGCKRSTTSSASSPSAASPTSSRSGWASRTIRKPMRSSSWSSTRTIDVRRSCPARRWAAGEREPRRASASRCRRAAGPRRSCRRRPRRARACRAARRPSGAATAVPAPWSRTSTATVVGAEGQRDLRAGAGARVLERVGQRLLDDPVDRQLQAGRDRAGGLTGDLVAHRQAGAAHLLDERVEPAQAGLGRQRRAPRPRRRARRAGRPAAGASRSAPGGRCARRATSPPRRGRARRGPRSRRRRPGRSSPTGCGRRCRASRARSASARPPPPAGPAGRARAPAARRAPAATPAARAGCAR